MLIFKCILAIVGLLTLGFVWWKGYRSKTARWVVLVAAVVFIDASDRCLAIAFGLPCLVVSALQVGILAGWNHLIYFIRRER